MTLYAQYFSSTRILHPVNNYFMALHWNELAITVIRLIVSCMRGSLPGNCFVQNSMDMILDFSPHSFYCTCEKVKQVSSILSPQFSIKIKWCASVHVVAVKRTTNQLDWSFFSHLSMSLATSCPAPGMSLSRLSTTLLISPISVSIPLFCNLFNVSSSCVINKVNWPTERDFACTVEIIGRKISSFSERSTLVLLLLFSCCFGWYNIHPV